jgi:hypothetical protein
VKNDYGTEKKARALSGLEAIEKNKKCDGIKLPATEYGGSTYSNIRSPSSK